MSSSGGRTSVMNVMIVKIIDKFLTPDTQHHGHCDACDLDFMDVKGKFIGWHREWKMAAQVWTGICQAQSGNPSVEHIISLRSRLGL